MRDGALEGLTEFYQFSEGLQIEYDTAKKEVVRILFQDKEVEDEDRFTLAIQSFHLRNIEKFMGVTEEEVSAITAPKVLSTSCTDVLDEYFSNKELVRASSKGRLILL